MLQTLARAIVHRYPAAWRERYADEVLALIAGGSVRFRDVLDLMRACIRERVLAMYEPSRHISAFRLISGLALIAFLSVLAVGTLAMSAVPFLLGYAIRSLAGPFPADVMDTAEWTFLSLFVIAVPWSFVQLHRSRSAHRRLGTAYPGSATKFLWILGAFYGGMAFLGGVSPDASFSRSYNLVLMPWMLLTQLWEPKDGIAWPGSNLFETLGRLRRARYDLRWARMELDRCEGIYAGREPGPELRAARAEMTRLTAEEAGAIASLDAMGYHARFQS